MSTVPITSSAELFRHFVRACEPLWCHRHTVAVTGNIYDVGDFRVRVGEVRQTQPQVRPRGTVVEVEWRGSSLLSTAASEDAGYIPTEEEIDTEYAQTAQMIREFWGRLDIANNTARESILVPDIGREVRQKLHQIRTDPDWHAKEAVRLRKRSQAIALDRSWAVFSGPPLEKEDDVDAGVDLARQYMEVFRFNR